MVLRETFLHRCQSGVRCGGRGGMAGEPRILGIAIAVISAVRQSRLRS